MLAPFGLVEDTVFLLSVGVRPRCLFFQKLNKKLQRLFTRRTVWYELVGKSVCKITFSFHFLADFFQPIF
jgi:hypothetical protein